MTTNPDRWLDPPDDDPECNVCGVTLSEDEDEDGNRVLWCLDVCNDCGGHIIYTKNPRERCGCPTKD